MSEIELKRVSKYIYEIPMKGGMKVPGTVFASEKLLKAISRDRTLEQVQNVAFLPGILKASMVLSDAHQGYGFPIGGVAAFDLDEGIISPGGVGYDINCGVRLLRTNLTKPDILARQKEVVEALYRKIPSGVGRGSKFKLTGRELDNVLEGGAPYIVDKGYGSRQDYLHLEEEGCMQGADSGKVSQRAKERGIGQLGTLGAGNHFLEIQVIGEIYDDEVARALMLSEGQIMIMIHCGSRGLGHQVASDYIKQMEREYGIEDLPDRELIHAPIKSQLGKDYVAAMAAAMNFAFANRQVITHWTREEMQYLFPNVTVETLYDVCHNIAKFEEHVIDGRKRTVCVHRKGATRSFGSGRQEIPVTYREVGQPVLIPGSMGTASYLLIGTRESEELTFGSCAHGAGRVISRRAALRTLRGEEVQKQLESKGIAVRAGGWRSIAEEAPQAYKDIDEVIAVMHELNISRKVARMTPLAVVKG
ncbi:MAG: RtcB family protein [Candidatus Neomarinimicrobiota bacterium]